MAALIQSTKMGVYLIIEMNTEVNESSAYLRFKNQGVMKMVA